MDGPQLAEDFSLYWTRLDELAQILHGLPWALAGGLAIPVTLGHFYRPHYDVDVIFPLEAFGDIEAAMRRGGFGLWTYFPFSVLGRRRGALHLPVSSSSPLARRRMRKLKFRDASGHRPEPHLLSVIEALPYRIEDDHFVTCDGRHRIPLAHPVIGHRHTTASGYEIACYHLHYVAYYKYPKTEPKHAEDLAIIESVLRAPAPAAD